MDGKKERKKGIKDGFNGQTILIITVIIVTL